MCTCHSACVWGRRQILEVCYLLPQDLGIKSPQVLRLAQQILLTTEPSHWQRNVFFKLEFIWKQILHKPVN